MGKFSRKSKKSKLDFDSFFDSTQPANEATGDGWHTGVSAMALDDVPAAEQPTTSGPAADGMDTTDYLPIGKSQKQRATGLSLQKGSLKILKRGSRTTAQQRRKASKQEKGLAHAEKTSSRVTKRTKRKQQVAALKTLY